MVLTGLYFFVISLFPVYSREPSSIRLLKPLLANEPYPLSGLPDSSQVHLSTTFDPLYSEKDRASDGDSQHIAINAHNISFGMFSRGARLSYYLSCRHDDLEATFRQRGENYLFTNRRKEWNITTGAVYRYQNLIIGAGLGRHLPENMAREHFSTIHADPEDYLLRGPWQLSVDAKLVFAKLAPRLSLFSGPVHSSVSKLVTSDGTSYRLFPLSIIRHAADVGFDIYTGSFSASSTFGIDYFENADLLTVPNRMPQDVAISNYRLKHSGMVRLPCTDSLGWEVSGSLAGGWIASYNFDRDRFTFFKSESVRLSHVQAEVGAKLPWAMTAGILRSDLQGTSPAGFLKLSALSAWSAFESLDYRYSGAGLTYHETGGFVNRQCTFSRFDIVPQLYASYLTARMGLRTSHREIVVLIPVYGDTVAQEMFNTRLILFEPSLAARARFGRLQISGSVHQELPVLLPSGKTSGPTALPEQPENNDNIITGGTRLFLSAVWRIPARGKRKVD